jgi:hypothetical protein
VPTSAHKLYLEVTGLVAVYNGTDITTPKLMIGNVMLQHDQIVFFDHFLIARYG